MKKRYWIPLLIIVAVPLSLFAFLKFPVFGGHPSDEDRSQFTKSIAFNKTLGVFENRRPELMEKMRADSSMVQMLQEWFADREAGRPTEALPQHKPNLAEFIKPGDKTKLIWLGHSSFLLNISGTIVLVDPMFSDYASPVSFIAQRFQPSVLSLDELPNIDLILISHDHYDHLDENTISYFAHSQTTFLAPLGVGVHLRRWGVANDRIVEKDWWESYATDSITFTAAPAQHFSGRDGINNNETLWASWILISSQSRLYFSGDSGYDTHFKEVGERFGPFDLSIMENGQYDKAWPIVHLFPSEAIQAHKDLNAQQLLPVHWGMFELAFHKWYEPVQALSVLADAEGIELITPLIGQIVTVGDNPVTERWWTEMM